VTLERAAEIFTVINFGVIGLSHVVQPRVWVEFFARMREYGHAGVFVNGMLSLMVGSIIVSLHNVWSGMATIVTLIGWAQVLKGLIALSAPAVSMKGIMRVSEERAHEFQWAGAAFLVLSAIIVWSWL